MNQRANNYASFLVGLSACVTFLTSCGSTPESDSNKETVSPIVVDEPQRTLNWMGHWERESLRETLVREIASDFSFRNPDIDLNLKFCREIMGEKKHRTTARLIAQMIREDKTDWDVIWLDDGIYFHVAKELDDLQWGKKYLVDLEAVPGYTAAHKDFIQNDPKYRDKTGGVLASPYLEGFLFTLWYNQDVADILGLEIKQRNMTMDDLLGYVRRLSDYNQEHGTEISVFSLSKGVNEVYLFGNLLLSELGDLENALETGYNQEKEAALKKTLLAFEEIGQLVPFKGPSDRSAQETHNAPLSDKCLFYISGTWMYSVWYDMDEEEMKKMIPTELPVFQPSRYTIGGYLPTWAILKNAPNRDDAVRLMLYISQPKTAEKWVRYTRNPTGLRGNFSMPDEPQDVWTRFQSDMSKKYGSNLYRNHPVELIFGKKDTASNLLFHEQIRLLLAGKTSADEVFQLLQAEVK